MDRQRVQFDVNPDVQTVIETGRHQEQRGRKKRQRRRPPARRKQYAQFNVAIDPRVRAMAKAIAETEGVSPSGIVEFFIVLGVRRYLDEQGETLADCLREGHTGNSPDWVVDLGELDQLKWDLDEFLNLS